MSHEKGLYTDDMESKGAVQPGILELVRTSTTTTIDPGPPPDGGLKAWTQALMAHLVIFNTWGYINSFGAFQTYYSQALDQPPSTISWVGSIQIFLLFFIGTFSGQLLDAGYFWYTFGVGSVLQLVGVFTASVSKTYWSLLLSQGVCTGIGSGLLFCPAVALASTYFLRNRSVAIGIAASGTATGGVVFPIIVRQLLPTAGVGWAIRTLGFIMVFNTIIVALFMRPRLPPRPFGPIIDWDAFRNPSYTLYAIGMFFSFWGIYFAFYYIGSFARSELGFAYQDSIDLLIIMNGIGLPGRIIPNFVADRWIGPLNMLLPFTGIVSVMLFGWPGVHSKAGVYAWAAMYGTFAAGIQSLFPATLSSLSSDPKKRGVHMGMVFTVVSFACLSGPPLGGALLTSDDGGYLYGQIWAALSILLASCFLVAARISKTGWKLRVRC
ncbi:hypothetical protein YB2330_006239 [Saitoella coloradoensis]